MIIDKYINTGFIFLYNAFRAVPYILIIILLFILFPFSMHGQYQKPTLETEEIDVIKAYKPILADAIKIPFSPPLKIDDSAPLTLNYYLPKKLLNIDYKPLKTRPLAMKRDKLTKLYNVYLKAGYGTFSTPLMEFYLNNTRNKKYSYGVSYDHLSMHDKKPENIIFNDNNSKIFGKYFFKKNTLYNEVNYDNNATHFYGYNANSDSSYLGDINQEYMHVSYNGKFYNIVTGKSKLNYNLGWGYYYFKGKGCEEENVYYSTAAAKELNSGDKLGMDFSVDFTSTRQSMQPNLQDNSIITISPYFNPTKEKLQAIVGIKPVTEMNNDSNTLHMFINCHISYKLFKNTLILKGGTIGNLQNNSLKSLINTNPFMADYSFIRNTKSTGFYVGFEGSPGRLWSYHLKADIKSIEFLPLYQRDTTDNENRFIMLYDSLTQVQHFYGEISYQVGEKFRLLASGDYYTYSLDVYDHPFYLPGMKINLFIFYNIGDKLLFTTNLYMISDIYKENGQKINNLIGTNFKINYKYSKNIGLFCILNNISSLRHQRWYYTPEYRFHFLGGLSFSF